MSHRLAQLHASLAVEAAAGRLILTGALLDADHLADQWLVLFGAESLTLHDAVVVDYDDGGQITVHGSTELLGRGRRPATLILLEASDRFGRYEDSIEYVLTFDEVVPAWRLADWFAPPPYPWSTAAFPAEFGLRDAALVVSSCDFVEPDGLVYSIDAPETPVQTPLGAGLNFRAAITGYDAVLVPAGPLGVLVEQPAYGLVCEAEDGDGLQLWLSYMADDDDGDGLASLSVSGLASLRVKVTELGCCGPIGSDARSFDAVTAAAEITLGGHVLDLDISLSGSHAALTGVFDGDKPLSFADIEHAFGLDGIQALLPGPLKHLGDVALVGFEAGLDLETLTLDRFGFEITTQHPWSLIEGVIAVQPYFSLSRHADGGETVTDVRVGGDWWLGSARFVVELDATTGDFTAGMAVGETLDVGAMLAQLLPGITPPDCALLDLDIDGNIDDGRFGLRIETQGGWHFDVGGAEIAIENIEITADYGAGALSGHLAGDITIADWRLQVDLILDDVCRFEVLIPELNVGGLADTFLALVHLPADVPDFVLSDMMIAISPSSGLFSIAGTSATTFEPFDGLEARITRFSAARSGEAGGRTVDAALELLFTIDGIPLVAAAEYRHVETGATPESEWLFTLRQGEAALSLSGLVEALERMVGLSYPLEAGDLVIADLALSFTLGGPDRRLAVACTILSGGDTLATFRLVAEKRGAAAWSNLVNVDVSLARLDPARLPLAGPMLRQSGVTLETLRVTRASQAISLADGARFADVAKGITLPLPAIAGLDVALLASGLGHLPIGLSVAGTVPSGEYAAQGDPSVPVAAPAIDETRWFSINKGFGPFTLERLGLRFENDRMTLVFDSHLSLQGLTLSLAGLGLASRLDRFDPEFRLDGVGLGFAAGPVGVSGGLLRRGAGVYAGSVRLETAGYAIGAIGQYADLGDRTSMFVFGVLEAPLGGPPCCYVRGVAAGLGLNSRLKTPDISGIEDFSLVQAAMPGAGFGGLALNDVLRAMDRDIHPEAGHEWLAAGLRFSSFELIQSVALLTVPLDNPGNMALIGLSRMSMPPEAPNPIAMIEIGLKATVRPASGELCVQGQLTRNSFLLSHDCHPTGGFAFCAWFAGEHEGDFVLTLGGYHPRFVAPPHYPAPARLAMRWQLSNALQIKGTSYFALVPNAVMAGGSMEAAWSSGPVNASFQCGYDFLIQWKPFAYDISITVQIHVEVDINLLFTSVRLPFNLGVELRLHGPPFGGEAHIDLDVVSFTIPFGSSNPDRTPLTWAQFKQSFLPEQLALPPGRRLAWGGADATNTICLARASGGLMRDLSKERDDLQWVLNGERLGLEIVCAIPVKQARYNGRAQDGPSAGGWSRQVGIAPAMIAAHRLQSDLDITLTCLDVDTAAHRNVEGVRIEPVVRSVPAALWSSDAGEDGERQVPPPSLSGERMVEGALVGFNLKPALVETHSTEAVPVSDLQLAHPAPLTFEWSDPRTVAAVTTIDVLAALARRDLATRTAIAGRGRRRFGQKPQRAVLGASPA